MDRELTTFIPILIFLVVLLAFVVGAMVFCHWIAPRKKTPVKEMPYESGMDPIGDARQHFDVKYYLVAILFLVFDVELLFLYPWAVSAYAVAEGRTVVTSVAWVELSSPLLAGPGTGNPESGKDVIMFPDARAPGVTIWDKLKKAIGIQDEDPSLVGVRARIYPPREGIRVYFKAIDLDDPSANTPPVDDENMENDNRGVSGFVPGETETAMGITDRSGVARVIFRVSLQPGDNSTVVASADPKYLARLRNVDKNGDGLDVYEYNGDVRGARVDASVLPAERLSALHDRVAAGNVEGLAHPVMPEGLRDPVFYVMISFLITLAIAYVYAWRKGVFKWR